jgi:hypothetical protein
VSPVLRALAVAAMLVAAPLPSARADAADCDRRVCIYIEGEGMRVDSWETIAEQRPGDGLVCDATAYFLANDYTVDVVQFTGCERVHPGQIGARYARTDDVPAQYIAGTRLCVRWTPDPPLSGKPCITIER